MGAVVVENGVARRVDGWPSAARPVRMGAQLVAGPLEMPGSHQLNKNPREEVRIRWSVTNQGDARGDARLRLTIIPAGSTSGGLVAESSVVPISPGFTIPLFLFWPVELPSGTSTAIISMADFRPGGTGLGDHVFSITVP